MQPDLVKVLFAFEDTPDARRTLAAALQDDAWLDKKQRPTLDVGFGLIEKHGLEVLSRAVSMYGAKLLVVTALQEKPIVVPTLDITAPRSAAPAVVVSTRKKEQK